jgi:hypothetical protein
MGIYNLRFLVTTDGAIGPKSVINGALSASPAPLPSRWSTYAYLDDTDPYSYARDYRVERDPKSVKRYFIDLTYRPPESGEGSATSGGDPVRSEPNPMDRPPVLWWDREVNTTRFQEDIEGTPIRNYAGDYYDDYVDLETPKSVLVVEFNVPTAGDVYTLQDTFDGAVNVSAWTVDGVTVPARNALCREVSGGPPITELGYTYFRVTMRFVFAEDGGTWDYRIPEYGYFWWKKSGGEYVTEIVDGVEKRAAGSDNGKAHKLAEDGTRLAEEEEPLFREWSVRRESDFSALVA